MSTASPRRPVRPRHRLAPAFGAAILAAAGLIGAAASVSGAAAPRGATAHPAAVVVHGVPIKKDAMLAGEVPAAVRGAGLKDITYNDFAPDEYVQGGKLVGWEVDLGEAVAAVLGLKWEPTSSGAFDTFIPGLQNGRFNTSFTSLIVTPARTKVIDIVSLYSVGTGFAAKAGGAVTKVTKPTDLCGDTVGVIVASAFIGQLDAINPSCTKAGKASVSVSTYPSDAAAELAVSSGRVELYATSLDDIGWLIHKTGHEFVQEPLNFMPTPEGVGVSKGVGLDKPIAAAVNALIANGDYKALMAKWGLTGVGLLRKAVDYT